MLADDGAFLCVALLMLEVWEERGQLPQGRRAAGVGGYLAPDSEEVATNRTTHLARIPTNSALAQVKLCLVFILWTRRAADPLW